MVDSAATALVVQVVPTVETTAAVVSREFVIFYVHISSVTNYADYSSGGGFRDNSSRRNYEYDGGDDDVAAARRSNSISGGRSASSPTPYRSAATPTTPAPPTKAKAPEPVPDLLGLDDDFAAPVATTSSNATNQPASHVDRTYSTSPLITCALLLTITTSQQWTMTLPISKRLLSRL